MKSEDIGSEVALISTPTNYIMNSLQFDGSDWYIRQYLDGSDYKFDLVQDDSVYDTYTLGAVPPSSGFVPLLLELNGCMVLCWSSGGYGFAVVKMEVFSDSTTCTSYSYNFGGYLIPKFNGVVYTGGFYHVQMVHTQGTAQIKWYKWTNTTTFTQVYTVNSYGYTGTGYQEGNYFYGIYRSGDNLYKYTINLASSFAAASTEIIIPEGVIDTTYGYWYHETFLFKRNGNEYVIDFRSDKLWTKESNATYWRLIFSGDSIGVSDLGITVYQSSEMRFFKFLAGGRTERYETTKTGSAAISLVWGYCVDDGYYLPAQTAYTPDQTEQISQNIYEPIVYSRIDYDDTYPEYIHLYTDAGVAIFIGHLDKAETDGESMDLNLTYVSNIDMDDRITNNSTSMITMLEGTSLKLAGSDVTHTLVNSESLTLSEYLQIITLITDSIPVISAEGEITFEDGTTLSGCNDEIIQFLDWRQENVKFGAVRLLGNGIESNVSVENGSDKIYIDYFPEITVQADLDTIAASIADMLVPMLKKITLIVNDGDFPVIGQYVPVVYSAGRVDENSNFNIVGYISKLSSTISELHLSDAMILSVPDIGQDKVNKADITYIKSNTAFFDSTPDTNDYVKYSGTGLVGRSYTELLSDVGLTATASEINTACDGATAKNSHTHDDRYATKVAFRARRTTAQAIATNTWTVIVFADEDYDYGSAYSTATGKFTAPSSGVYHFDAGILSANVNWNDDEIMEICLYKNGSQYVWGDRWTSDYDNTRYVSVHVSGDIYLTATDYVEVRVYHNQGGNINTHTSYNYFNGHRVY